MSEKVIFVNGALGGKVNIPYKTVDYKGVETNTATISVDNNERTISANVNVEEVTKNCATEEDINTLSQELNTLSESLDNKVSKVNDSNILYGRGNNSDWNPSYSSDYNNKDWQIVQRDGNSDVLVPTTPSSDNASASKKYVDDSVASKESYKTFPNSWVTNSTTLAFCQSIQSDTNAHAGSAYLGTLMCNDLPSGMVQVEAIVDIISEGANGKCVNITITSLEIAPYRWTYSYGIVNGSVRTVGWLGTQEQLVSGSNIKTINNESLLGSGNISLPSAEWGSITGTLSDQTDLKNYIDDSIAAAIGNALEATY